MSNDFVKDMAAEMGIDLNPDDINDMLDEVKGDAKKDDDKKDKKEGDKKDEEKKE